MPIGGRFHNQRAWGRSASPPACASGAALGDSSGALIPQAPGISRRRGRVLRLWLSFRQDFPAGASPCRASHPPPPQGRARTMASGHMAFRRSVIIGAIGFLTLVDLFATQAILPSLAKAYAVSPAAIGFAVNASTMGMAAACLGVALISRHLNRRLGIWISLGAARRPDLAAGRGAGSCHVYRAAHRAGRLHGDGLHPHHGVSRRTLQRRRNGKRARRLHNGRGRQQSGRPARFGLGRRPHRPAGELLSVRGAQSRRRGAGHRQSRPHVADGSPGKGALAAGRAGASICAIRRCAPVSASAF